MNFVSDPVHCACKYLKSETSFSVVLSAKAEVDGFGGRLDRASPYAGPSCSLTSSTDSHCVNYARISIWHRMVRRGTCVAIVLSGQKSVSISSDNTFEVATVDVEKQACQYGKQGSVVSRIDGHCTFHSAGIEVVRVCASKATILSR
jgi:hypothetical protein